MSSHISFRFFTKLSLAIALLGAAPVVAPHLIDASAFAQGAGGGGGGGGSGGSGGGGGDPNDILDVLKHDQKAKQVAGAAGAPFKPNCSTYGCSDQQAVLQPRQDDCGGGFSWTRLANGRMVRVHCQRD